MALFDKLSDLAAQAAQKSEELVESGKTNIEAAKYRKQIGDLIEEIGKAVYEQYGKGVELDPAINDLCVKIKSLEEAIAKLQGEEAAPAAAPAAEPAGTPCAACGAQVAAGLKFCPQCGQAMTAQCAACGAQVEPGVKFCPQCGQAM